MNTIHEFLNTTLGITAENQIKIFISLFVILFLWIIQLLILRFVWRQVKDVKVRYQWKRSLSVTVPFIGILLVGGVWLSAFKQFGAFLGLMAAGFAIALKDPLTNLAGWLFFLFRKLTIMFQ